MKIKYVTVEQFLHELRTNKDITMLDFQGVAPREVVYGEMARDKKYIYVIKEEKND